MASEARNHGMRGTLSAARTRFYVCMPLLLFHAAMIPFRSGNPIAVFSVWRSSGWRPHLSWAYLFPATYAGALEWLCFALVGSLSSLSRGTLPARHDWVAEPPPSPPTPENAQQQHESCTCSCRSRALALDQHPLTLHALLAAFFACSSSSASSLSTPTSAHLNPACFLSLTHTHDTLAHTDSRCSTFSGARPSFPVTLASHSNGSDDNLRRATRLSNSPRLPWTTTSGPETSPGPFLRPPYSFWRRREI